MNAWPTYRKITSLITFPVLGALALSVVHSFSPMLGLLLIPFVVLAVAAWAAIMLYRAVAAAFRRSWRGSLQILLVVAVATPLAGIALLSGDYVHLAIMYPVYASVIRNNQRSETSFSWGGTGFAGSANSVRVLVYDQVGTLASKIGVTPLADEPGVSVFTTHLTGHFYIRELSW